MPELTPDMAQNSEQVLYGFIVLALLFFPFIAAGFYAIRKSNEQQNAKPLASLTDDDIGEIAGTRATGTVFFLLALFVVFLLAAWGGTKP